LPEELDGVAKALAAEAAERFDASVCAAALCLLGQCISKLQ
jgi:hypothetical protein